LPTAAGVREVDLLPLLRDELTKYKMTSAATRLDDPVFVTSSGAPRDRHNVRQRVVAPAVKRADELLAERGSQPLPTGLSPHKLRHSFASLLVALGGRWRDRVGGATNRPVRRVSASRSDAAAHVARGLRSPLTSDQRRDGIQQRRRGVIEEATRALKRRGQSSS